MMTASTNSTTHVVLPEKPRFSSMDRAPTAATVGTVRTSFYADSGGSCDDSSLCLLHQDSDAEQEDPVTAVEVESTYTSQVCQQVDQVDEFEPMEEVRKRIVSLLHNLDECLFTGGGGDQGQLLEAYKLMKLNTSCCGENLCNVVLITGSERNRTSALAHSIRKHAEKDEVCVISGRFTGADGVHPLPVEPFKAYVDALTQFANQVVAEGEEAVERLRKGVQANIAVGTKQLVDTIPALGPILGEGTSDSSERASHRSCNAIMRFVAIISTFLETIVSQQPLLMILEDLHLADPCSLGLLPVLARNAGVKFVCTCRADDKEDSVTSHVASSMMSSLHQSGVSSKHIQVQDLHREDVDNLVSDILNLPKATVSSLSSLLCTQTRGNAVFIVEAIKSLLQHELLTRDENGSWSWNESQVHNHLQADSVGDFLFGCFRSLPPQLKELMKVASCLGNSRLDEEMLSYALAAPVGHYLAIASDQGLLKQDLQTGSYSFAHEGIQSASYELIEHAEREKFHLAVARRLSRRFERLEELDKRVFVVLDQFQRGKRHIERNEKYVAVTLSILAAQRAFRSSSFKIASACFTFGISLLDRNSFKDEHDLCVTLHTNAAEVYFIMGQEIQMDGSIDAVLQNALGFRNKLGVLATRVYALGTRNKAVEAVEVAHDVLADLGEPVERNPGRRKVMAKFKHVKKLLKNKSEQRILRMERMTDPDKLAALQVLNVLFLNAHTAESQGAPLIGLKMVELTLQHGLCAASSFGFAIYAYLMSDQDVDKAFKYAQLALSIIARFNAREWIPRVHFLVYGYIQPWKMPAIEYLDALKEGHTIGMETGDIGYAMLCANLYVTNAVAILPADELFEETNVFVGRMVMSKQDMALEWMDSLRNTLRVLLGRNAPPAINDQRKELKTDPRTRSMHTFVTSYNQVLLACIFEKVDDCGRLAKSCWEQLEKKQHKSYQCCDFAFICGLASAVTLRSSRGRREQTTYKRILKGAIKKLQTWSKSSPLSTCSKLFLLKAEAAALCRNDKQAAREYLVAIATAQSAGFQYEVAMGNECAARFFLSQGKEDETVTHYKKALEAYAGAKVIGKVNHLQRELNLLLERLSRTRLSTENVAPMKCKCVLDVVTKGAST